jgi:hypothetical protein
MGKRILMIAFHFPPVKGSSGVHRTLNFSRHLKEDHGWEPTVLTIHPRAYENTSDDQMSDIAEGVEVVRAFGVDTARHLAIRGRYPRAFAIPDRWTSWKPFAVRAACRAHRAQPFDVVWSTYPIATAHAIGAKVARRTGAPWIADFRDSMTEEGYPANPKQRSAYLAIERLAVEHSARAIFTTPGTRTMYAERYPHVPTERWAVIGNGYDERSFASSRATLRSDERRARLLVHAGVLYRSERDPRCFFDALARLKSSGAIDSTRLRIHLRASGDEAYHVEQIARRGIGDLVFLLPPVPYREALAEMQDADGLLLFQASNCNHQIPAKAYEYLRAQRPVLALTDPSGDTAQLITETQAGMVVPLDDANAIETGLRRFIPAIESSSPPIAPMDVVRRHSRRARASELAAILESLPTAAPD